MTSLAGALAALPLGSHPDPWGPLMDTIEARVGNRLFMWQAEALYAEINTEPTSARVCLYYRTGAGKTLTSLLLAALWGQEHMVVIAPPSTHEAWVAMATRLGMSVECMSHAKFRQPGTKLKRDVGIIADEFHLFGGHTGQGWKKFDRLARGLKAPIILASATPNYNDAERVYCIQHVLDPSSCPGGFIAFLYEHCITVQNPFSMTPDVEGFKLYDNAADYLVQLPGVHYLPDELVWSINEMHFSYAMPDEYHKFGLDPRNQRMVASQMEDRHTRVNYAYVADNGAIKGVVYEILTDLVGNATTPVLIFAAHATVAEALAKACGHRKVNYALVTGKTSAKEKAAVIRSFNRGDIEVLVGTASLATGTDGMDKVCDTLIILDDTDDDSLRRQLVGRIMPRGLETDASNKHVYRISPVFT